MRASSAGIFSNADDDLDGMRAALAEHLDRPSIDIVGCVAVFPGTINATAP